MSQGHCCSKQQTGHSCLTSGFQGNGRRIGNGDPGTPPAAHLCSCHPSISKATGMIVRRLLQAKPSRHQLRLTCGRSFAAGSGLDGNAPVAKVFDRTAKRRQRDRAAAADWEGEFDYLREHIARVLVDRLEVGKGCTFARSCVFFCFVLSPALWSVLCKQNNSSCVRSRPDTIYNPPRLYFF